MDDLIASLQAFMNRHDLEPAPMGKKLINDTHLWEDITRQNRPRALRKATITRIKKRMAEMDAKLPPPLPGPENE